MGYSVYEQEFQHRWAGYGVPGLCDHPKCGAKLPGNRGMAHLCEEHIFFAEEDVAEDDPIMMPGCDLFFCHKHEGVDFEKHWDYEPKPDLPEWERYMLTDPSWAFWRKQNPERVQAMQERNPNAGTPDS